MKFINTINDKIGLGISFLVLAMILFIVFEVASRDIFDAPTLWGHESTQLAFAIYVIFAGAYAHLRRVHVQIDILYALFTPKVRLVIDWFSFALLVAYCGTIIWQGTVMAWVAMVDLEVSVSPFHPPLYPFKMMIPVATVLFLLQGVFNMRRGGRGQGISR